MFSVPSVILFCSISTVFCLKDLLYSLRAGVSFNSSARCISTSLVAALIAAVRLANSLVPNCPAGSARAAFSTARAACKACIVVLRRSTSAALFVIIDCFSLSKATIFALISFVPSLISTELKERLEAVCCKVITCSV